MLSATIAETMRRISYREYLFWCDVFKEEYNTPSRSDWYLMQIAAEVRISRMRKGSVALRDMKLSFSSEEKRMSPEERMRHSKAVWGAVLGIDWK